MCVGIVGVFLAVEPFGGIASLKEMFVDFSDVAGAGLALRPSLGLEAVILGFSAMAVSVSCPGCEASSCGAALPVQWLMLAVMVRCMSSVM